MKIRTDFVTNSSSSSFVVATIETSSTELCELLQSLQSDEIKITPGRIQINSQEIDYGFRHSEPTTPRKLVKNLLEIAGITDVSKESISKYSNSIISYEMEVGYSAGGDSDALDSTYIDNLSKEKGIDPDELWAVFAEKNGWITEKKGYIYTETKQVKKVYSISGPIDNYSPVQETAIFGEAECEPLPYLVSLYRGENPVLDEILKKHHCEESWRFDYVEDFTSALPFPYYGVNDTEEITKSLMSYLSVVCKDKKALISELLERFEEIRNGFTVLSGGYAEVIDPEDGYLEGYDFELVEGKLNFEFRSSWNFEW